VTRVLAGHFNEAIILDYVGDTLYIVQTNNVLFRDYLYNWSGIEGNVVSDTIKTFIEVGGQLYFGGSASLSSNSSGVVLSRYMNNVMQPVLTTNSFYFLNDPTVSINAIGFHPTNNRLCIGGDFLYFPSMGSFSRNLAYYNALSNTISSLAMLDKPVNTMAWHNATINFGGDFTTNLTNIPVSRIGKIGPHLSLDEHHPENPIQVFPNPTGDVIHVSGINSSSPYQMFDLNGRVVLEGTVHESSTIDLSGLLSGVYVLQVQLESGVVSSRIVKQ